MKETPGDKNATKTLSEWLSVAKEKESEQKTGEAIDAYEHIIKEHPKNENAYQRLMILYRKKKEYKKELKVIDTALKNFRHVLGKKPQAKQNRKISQLSMQLNKTTGLTGKNNEPAFFPEPLHKWTKRRQAVLQRISKSRSLNVNTH